jgi:hypothetical protein
VAVEDKIECRIGDWQLWGHSGSHLYTQRRKRSGRDRDVGRMRLDRHAAGRRLDKGKHFTAAGVDVEHAGRRAARRDREVEIAPGETF